MGYPRVDVARTCAAVSVAITSTVLLAANPSRVEVTFVNLDVTNPVFLVFSTAVGVAPTATANGLRLAPGASFSTRSYVGAVAAIATTAPCSVHVSEF